MFLKYFDYLRDKLGIRLSSYHWVAKDYKDYMKGFRQLVNLHKKMGILDFESELKRECSQRHCLNPLHYNTVSRQWNDLESDEVEALYFMIDMDSLEVIGFEKNFEAFNMGNPLPAKECDFFVACNRKLKKANKPLIKKGLYDA